ncbi:MAG: hypothetical protein DHS20C01_37850 [marine bacterium B5-7]|nr:MAG: hypothetical protein DHS20C01_37850 [marine bacterium B5-7]
MDDPTDLTSRRHQAVQPNWLFPVFKAWLGMTSSLWLLSATPAYGEVMTGPSWFIGGVDAYTQQMQQATAPETDQAPATADERSPAVLKSQAMSESAILSALAIPDAVSEIQELARGLQYDPARIYQYVHNHIDFTPYYGYLKGPRMTLLDRSGNDLDQSALTVALLRESGFSANLVFGTMDIPIANGHDDDDLSHWLNTAADDAIEYLFNGGFPIDKTHTGSDIPRVWVRVTLADGTLDIDPAFKRYDRSTATDLATAMGYDRNALMNAAGGTGSDDSITGLDDNGIRATLKAWSGNLIDHLASTYPNADGGDVLGQSSIRVKPMALDTIPFATTVMDVRADVPEQYVHKVRIKFSYDDDYIPCSSWVPNNTGIEQWLNFADILGHQLVLDFSSDVPGNTNMPAYLRLDGTIIDSDAGSFNVGCGTNFYNRLILTVDHPYDAANGTYMDQEYVTDLTRGSTYVFIAAAGGSHHGNLLKSRYRHLQNLIAEGASETSRQVRRETLNILGQTWFQQTRMQQRLHAQLLGANQLIHHRLGLVGQSTGYYVDVPLQASTIDKLSELDRLGKPSVLVSSALEHGVLEQTQANAPAVSTVKLLYLSQQRGKTLYRATQDNFTTIRSQLTGYTGSFLDSVASYLDNAPSGADQSVYLPQEANITLQNWRGNGYIVHNQAGDGSSTYGMIIGGGLSGGFNATGQDVSPVPVLTNGAPITLGSGDTPQSVSSDPVNLFNGAFVHDQTDLAIGSAVAQLASSRHYNSNERDSERSMGRGWRHGYDINITEHSHAGMAFGERTAIEAVAALVTNVVALDLLASRQPTAREWAVAIHVAQWLTDEINQNAVSIQGGHEVGTYIKLPDGRYAAPRGSTRTLVNTGSGYEVRGRFGGVTRFNTDRLIASITDVDNNTVQFTYNDQQLRSVTSNQGHRLDFSYQGEHLTGSPTTAGGRSVTPTTARMI